MKKKNIYKLTKIIKLIQRTKHGKTEVFTQHFYRKPLGKNHIPLNKLNLNDDHMFIINTLLAHTNNVYIVGGAVRDYFLKIQVKDIDIATDLKPDKILEIFSGYAKKTGNIFPTVRVRRNNTEVEISTFRKEIISGKNKKPKIEYAKTIYEDLSRRDLSINSIAIHAQTGKIIDPNNGIRDIQENIIRFVGKPQDRIYEDPLRFFRAIRFRAKINGKYETETFNALREKTIQNFVIENLPAERIREELMKTLESTQKASTFFKDLYEFEMLKFLFPELEKTIKHDGGPHHGEDVFTHCMLVGDFINTKNNKSDKKIILTKLAAYLHDIGKPASYNKETRTFYNHDIIGAQIIEKSLKNLKFSKNDIEFVSKLVYYHMKKPTTLKGLRSLLLDFSSTDIKYLIEIFHGDTISNLRKTQDEIKFSKEKIENIKNLLETILSKNENITPPISGHTLINELGLKPGKIFKDILNYAQKLTIENPNITKEQILLSIKAKFFPNNMLTIKNRL